MWNSSKRFREHPPKSLESAVLLNDTVSPTDGHISSNVPTQSSPAARNAALPSTLGKKKKKKKAAKTFQCPLRFKSIATTGALNLTLDLLIQEIYSMRGGKKVLLRCLGQTRFFSPLQIQDANNTPELRDI